MVKEPHQPSLDEDAVRAAYRAWAPVYDYTIGVVAGPGRRLAVSILNAAEGRVLEIGIGTEGYTIVSAQQLDLSSFPS